MIVPLSQIPPDLEEEASSHNDEVSEPLMEERRQDIVSAVSEK
jgi:hypothetical protein